MYLNYYGLKKEPFHITPDPGFLYLSPSHKEALAAIIYGIEQKKGFVAIIGPVGVGKTTILRSYLESCDKSRTKTVYIFNSRLTFEELLTEIYEDLSLPLTRSGVAGMVNGLYDVLLKEYSDGNTVVLVIDEAQNMPIDTLESLRMISNLETSTDKLIQIVLVGQPEFEEQLNTNKLRQLKQRLAIRSAILPLTKSESTGYIQFRLAKAGQGDWHSVFSEAALNEIVRAAQGVPRVLNVLCDNALITGFGYQKKPVNRRMVKEAVRDIQRGTKNRSRKAWLSAACVIVLLTGCTLAFHFSPFAHTVFLSLPHHFDRARSVISPLLSTENKRVESPEGALVSGSPKPPVGAKQQNLSATRSQDTIARMVKTGDTLLKLTRDVYGTADSDILNKVLEGNPQISNPNTIRIGSVIRFPGAPELSQPGQGRVANE